MKNRILKNMLFVAVLTVLCFFVAFTANATVYEGNCGADGDNLTWTLDTETGVLEINGSGAMKDYSTGNAAVVSPWYNESKYIQSITLNNGITYIGRLAFTNVKCREIYIPESVEKISENSFNSSELKSITVSEDNNYFSSSDGILFDKDKKTILIYPALKSNESYVIPESVQTIGYEAFSYSKNLKYVEITENVRKIESLAFSDCRRLQSVVIKEGLQILGNAMFAGCYDLTNISIPKSLSDFTMKNNSFRTCSLLDSVNIDPDNPYFTVVDGVVYNKDLTELVLYPNGKSGDKYTVLDSTEIIGTNAFESCKLSSVILPDGLLNINYGAFFDSSITNIKFPESLKVIGDFAFDGCNELYSINIPDSVTTIGRVAFAYCERLTRVTIGNGINELGDHAFEMCDNLETLIIDADATITTIPGGLCENSYSLKKVVLPGTITSIEYYAFSSFPRQEFDLYFLGTRNQWLSVKKGSCALEFSTITYYYLEQGYTFRIDETKVENKTCYHSVIVDCDTKISGIQELPKTLGGQTVTILEGAVFSGCNQLTKMTIHESIASLEYSAFNNCTALSAIDVSENNTAYASIDGVLFDKACQTLITYPQAKTSYKYSIPQGVTTIAPDTMKNCSILRNVEIPASVINISTSIFSGCNALRNIIVSKDNAVLYSVNGVLFENWSNILLRYPVGKTATSYTIPDGTATINSMAFYPCKKLNKIVIPESLSEIQGFAFAAAIFFTPGSITEVVYNGSPSQWNKIKIAGGNTCITSANLTCLKKDPDLSQPTTPFDKYDEWNKLSSDTETFQRAHYNFAETYALSFLKYNRSFYTNVWSAENSKRMLPSLIWKVVGDVGEVMQFKFKDLTIKANYYDLFVSDLVLAMNNVDRTNKFSVGLAKNYNKYVGSIMKLFKSTKEWEEATADGMVLDVEVEGFLTKPRYEIPENLESILSKVFKDVFTNHKYGFTNIFKFANSANQMLDYVSKGADIINAFKKAYDTYVIVETFKDMDSEFYDLCHLVAAEMEKENVGLANAFLKSVYKYENAAADDEALFDSLLTLNIETLNVAYDLTIKDVFKNVSYTLIAKMLNCSTASLNILSTTYNLTYHVLNGLTKNGTKSNYYSLMYYAAPVEKALMTVVSNKEKIFTANYLYNQKESYQSAKNFDLSYNMWRCTNMYLYECAYNFLAAQKIQDEMKLAKQYKDSWNKIKCHNGLADVTSSKLVTVSCPVDIYVYDTDMNIVLSVENEIPTYCDDKISLSIANGVKMFSYPATEEYFIDIKARESGEMDYNITEIKDNSVTRKIEFYGIDLIKDKVYSGSIPYELDLDNSEYQLVADKNQIFCDYDSLGNLCESGEHQFGSWSYVTTPNIGELDYEERVCSVCGKHEKKTVHNAHTDLLVGNYVEATCISEGYSGDTYCALCGEIIQTGIITPKTDHNFSKEEKLPTCTQEGHKTYTCSVCQYTYTEIIPATGHTDKNNDDKCDFCGASLGEAPTDPSTACNHICHKTGFMGFIYKIIRIFWKLFRINQYCSCGAKHW